MDEDFAKQVSDKIKDDKANKRRKILRVLPRSKLEGMVDPETRPWLAEKTRLIYQIISNWSENDEDEVVDYIRNMIQ